MPQDQAQKGNDQGTGKPTNQTVGVSIDMLTAENTDLHKQVTDLTAERDTLQEALKEANAILEADVREEAYKAIMGMSNYTRAELEQQYPIGDQQALKALQKLRESLARGMGAASASKGTFKPVSAAKDSVVHGTVPDLYGKNRTTILKELSEVG